MDNLHALSADLAEQLDEAAERPRVDPKSLPVRFSRLKRFGQSAAHYYAACQWAEDGESLALRLGSGVHALILGTPPIVRYPGVRRGKAWDAFKAAHAGEVILTASEYREASGMSASVLGNREAMRILFEDASTEEHIEWSNLGRRCSSRPDSYSRHHVAELKTARTANPFHFTRDALRMHYHGQCAWYLDAIEDAKGYRPSSAYIVCVEKGAPYVTQVYKLTERAIVRGLQQNRLWMESLLQAEASDEWPGYSESILDLDTEDDDPISLSIDGELYEVP